MVSSTNLASPKRAERAMWVLGLTLIVTVMNATMFNVALPHISLTFDLTNSAASWTVTAYIIVYAVATVVYGKLADKIRLKNLLTCGLLAFAIGSVAGLTAQTFWMIISARVLQAAGGAAVTAASMIVPVRYFAPSARGGAMATAATGVALGTAAGPIVSGLVTSVASWRCLFLLSLPALLAIPFFRRYLDDPAGTDMQTNRPIDLWGGAFLGGTVAMLLLAATRASVTLLAMGLLLLALLVLRIRLAEEPFIQPALFVNKRFSFALLLAGLSSLAIFSLPYLIPQLLGKVNALTPLQVGFAMFPGSAAAAILGRRGGKIADKQGVGRLFLGACVLFASGFALLSWAAGSSPVWIVPALVIGSVGQTFSQIALSHLVSGTLTGEQTGVGMGLYSMASFIAGAVSTATMGRMLDIGPSARMLHGLLGGGAEAVFRFLFVGLTALVLLTAILYAKFAKSRTWNEHEKMGRHH